MSREAFNAMLAKAPFPVMRAAYQGKPISAGEMKALAGFMQQADQERASREPRSYGWRTFLAASAGSQSCSPSSRSRAPGGKSVQ